MPRGTTKKKKKKNDMMWTLCISAQRVLEKKKKKGNRVCVVDQVKPLRLVKSGIERQSSVLKM